MACINEVDFFMENKEWNELLLVYHLAIYSIYFIFSVLLPFKINLALRH